MVIENEIPQFFQWLPWALLMWFVVGLVFALVGVGISFLFAVIGQGPEAGLRSAGLRLKEGTLDLLSISPRRIYALSVLSVQEAVRRKVFVAFGLFILVLLFAAWFLNPADGTKPAKLFLDFVLTWTTYLLLAIGLFLSVFSLPNDISNHTIFTVVTKPVRPTEIVLGRIFGFTAICSVMLLVMGILSYFFVTRTLSHRHEILGGSLSRKIDDQGDPYFEGTTTSTQDHTHDVRIEIAATSNKTDVVNEHFHRISEDDDSEPVEISNSEQGEARGKTVLTSVGHGLADDDIIRIDRPKDSGRRDVWVVENCQDDTFVLKDSSQGGDRIKSYVGSTWKKVRYVVASAEDFIKARVSIHASQLRFVDNAGKYRKGYEGTNIGHEWLYRKYVEGGTQSAGRFRFSGLQRSMFPKDAKVLTLEMTLGVFRTRKGDMEKPIPGQVRIGRPVGDDDNGPWLWSEVIPFQSNEEQTLPLEIPVTLKGSVEGSDERKEYSFPEGFVNKHGDLWVEIKCAGAKGVNAKDDLSRAQFLGMAKHDVYFVASRASPSFNFMKGCFSIWLQVVLVTSIGVMFSTFLNGFVGLLATAATILGGYSVQFIQSLTDPDVIGGAAVESAVRIIGRNPMVTDLNPDAFSTDVILWLDSGVRWFLWLILQALPDMSLLSSVNYVSQGFNIPLNNLCYQFVVVLGFLIPLCLLGHYVLKGRELAK